MGEVVSHVMSDQDLSLWFDQLTAAGPLVRREPLDGDTTADVTIVGGGLTGLWTAYYLTEADPDLDVLVVEAETVGFGASGRNGGWCSALFPQSAEALARKHGHDKAVAMRAAMRDTVVEIGGVVKAEQIDCGFTYGGTVTMARSGPQLRRITAEAEDAARWGDEIHLLDADGVAEHLVANGVIGGSWTPDCARVQPAQLVRGLGDVVERRGVRIAEQTRVTRVSPGAVVTEHGTVRTGHVVLATEAWLSTLPGRHRDIAPVYSLMIATEPLSAQTWQRIGLDKGQTFTDGRHLIIYGQRTADDRFAFGGRGAPYHWASRIREEFDRDATVAGHLTASLRELFDGLDDVAITHTWGGPLGIPRDWHASVGMGDDRIGWAGGYVGDGVGTTNLAGRTLADLVTGTASPLVDLPWVQHRSRRWEPEPLRWAAISAGLSGAVASDAEERLTRRPSVIASVLGRFLGH